MKIELHSKIKSLISQYDIEKQEELAEKLNESGFQVTQATISRDIKELQLVKTLSSSGKYKYAVSSSKDLPVSDRFVKIFRQTVTSVDHSGNIIIIKTLSGCANAAGEAIDTSNMPHIKGSLAGDNTLLLIADDPENVPAIIDEFNNMLYTRAKND